jgi:hypothetical protein
MKTRVCDLCGKRCMKTGSDWYISFPKIYSFFELQSRRFDVCERCMNDFKAWQSPQGRSTEAK